MGRGRLPAESDVVRPQDLGDLSGIEQPPAAIDHSSDQQPDHLVQESISFDPVLEALISDHPSRFENGAHGVRLARFGPAESGEVVRADDLTGGSS